MEYMIVLAFWGLTRSTQHTIESIVKNIYSELPVYKVFVHTYSSKKVYANRRAGESAFEIKPEIDCLNPWKAEIDDLDAVKQKLNLEKYHLQPDPWNTNYETLDNFVLAMYSKMRVTAMIAESGLPFSKVIFLRPDVVYRTNIRDALLAATDENAWVIPNFHLIRGFNDRFCIASTSNYMHYGCVFPLLLEYSKRRPLHSETFYADYATSLRIRIVRVPFLFQRVRMNGRIDPRDLSLFKDSIEKVRRNAANPKHVKLNDAVFRHLMVRPAIRHPFFAF